MEDQLGGNLHDGGGDMGRFTVQDFLVQGRGGTGYRTSPIVRIRRATRPRAHPL
jgi:hypothetical protein